MKFPRMLLWGVLWCVGMCFSIAAAICCEVCDECDALLSWLDGDA